MKPQSIGILVLVLTAQAAAQEKAKPTQEQAIAAIKKLGGSVTLDEKKPGKPVIVVDLSKTKVTDAELVYLKGLTNLQTLELSFTKVTDAGLVHLIGLTKLRSLFPGRTEVTGSGPG